ncbi:MAG TPA: ATP-binding protein [Chloroflexota bacterium]
MLDELRVAIQGEDGIVAARQAAREAARGLGFGPVDQTRITTAVSELARNVVRYATGGKGEMRLWSLPVSERGVGLEILVADDGPGIEDVKAAMQDGVTSGMGLGMGLPGAQRLVDELEIDSAPGRGTVVTIRKWHR